MIDEYPTKEDLANQEMGEISERLEEMEEKMEEIEIAVRGLIQNLHKNLEMMQSIHETFQNLNAYLKVNVGPPLFLE